MLIALHSFDLRQVAALVIVGVQIEPLVAQRLLTVVADEIAPFLLEVKLSLDSLSTELLGVHCPVVRLPDNLLLREGFD